MYRKEIYRRNDTLKKYCIIKMKKCIIIIDMSIYNIYKERNTVGKIIKFYSSVNVCSKYHV